MSACNTKSWANSSRANFGLPAVRYVKPQVRVNGQGADIPDGYKIKRCFVEQSSLFQSGLETTLVDTAGFVLVTELIVPANEIVPGERFNAKLGAAVAPIVGTSATMTAIMRIVDASDTVVSTANVVTHTITTSGASKHINFDVDFYYDASDSQLHLFAKTRNDATYATFVPADMNINVSELQKIQLGLSLSSVALGEVTAPTYASIGRLN